MNKSRVDLSIIATVVLVVILGILGSIQAYKIGDREARHNLLNRTETAAAAIDPEELIPLKGDRSDLTSEDYESLKKNLTKIKMANDDVRFVYLFGYRNNDIFFYMDSEPAGSPDASLPGDIYEEKTAQEVGGFVSGIPFTEGPARDRWGEWISAFSPIRNPNTGEIIALLGMDIDSSDFNRQIRSSLILPIGLAILALVLVLAYASRINLLKEHISAVEEDGNRLKAVIEQFPHGILIEGPDRKPIIANRPVMDVFTRDGNLDSYLKGTEGLVYNKMTVTGEKVDLGNGKYILRSYTPFFYKDEYRAGIWTFKEIA